MNATETLIRDTITNTASHDVTTLVNETGKSETTVRKALKNLVAEGAVRAVSEGRSTLYYTDNLDQHDADQAAMDADVMAGQDFDADVAAEAQNVDTVSVQIEAKTEPVAPAARPHKKYIRHATPLTRTTRLNQITKSEVQVLATSELPADSDFEITEKWTTICKTHNQAVGADLVKDAHWNSSYPEFCTGCAPSLVGKVGRRRKAPVAA